MDRSSSPSAEDRRLGVVVEEVSAGYGIGKRRVEALANISFTVPDKSITAVVGPSGCGKSTLIRLLCGLTEPDSGRITIDGRSPGAIRSAEAVGVAFQDPALLPWRSVRGNVRLPLDLRGRRADRRHIDDLIRRVGLTDFATTRPGHLSGGMRQRVSIARALAVEPELLLLDEPFGALDDITRDDLNTWLRSLQGQRPTTTVLVTHSIHEAVFLADQVIVITPRPGHVAAAVKVPFSGDRDERFRRSETFGTAVNEVSAALTTATR